MPKRQTQTSNPVNPSSVGSTEWFYNEIMLHIEPELLTDRIPTLATAHAGETAEERERRVAHYNEAFSVFDKVFADLSGELFADAYALRQEAHRRIHEQEERERKQDASDAESLIETA